LVYPGAHHSRLQHGPPGVIARTHEHLQCASDCSLDTFNIASTANMEHTPITIMIFARKWMVLIVSDARFVVDRSYYSE
jgi:hypothetical protein